MIFCIIVHYLYIKIIIYLNIHIGIVHSIAFSILLQWCFIPRAKFRPLGLGGVGWGMGGIRVRLGGWVGGLGLGVGGGDVYVRLCQHMGWSSWMDFTDTYMHVYLHTYIHTYVHAYIHTYIRTYIHTYIYIYIYCRHRNYINLKFRSLTFW